jgi:hypothetical protein
MTEAARKTPDEGDVAAAALTMQLMSSVSLFRAFNRTMLAKGVGMRFRGASAAALPTPLSQTGHFTRTAEE